MSTKNQSLTVQKRTLTGRKVKQLRRDGHIPANLFGKKIASQSVQVGLIPFQKVYEAAGETGIIDLQVEGESKIHPVLISQVQSNPVTNQPVHVDFRQVILTEKVKATIPVELIGEAPAVKEKGAVVIASVQELEVEALPADLPSVIEVDISVLTDVDQSILLKDVKMDRSIITLSAPEDTTIVTSAAQATEPEPEPTAEDAEGEEAAAPESEAKTEGESESGEADQPEPAK